MVLIKNLVAEIYANGAELVVSPDGKSVGLKGNPPQRIHNEVFFHKDDLLAMLAGDPLQGPGWEGRTALYRQALAYLDKVVERKGLDHDAAIEALCRIHVNDRLNEAWCDGSFEEFRGALKEYVQAGLDAARGKKPKLTVRAS